MQRNGGHFFVNVFAQLVLGSNVKMFCILFRAATRRTTAKQAIELGRSHLNMVIGISDLLIDHFTIIQGAFRTLVPLQQQFQVLTIVNTLDACYNMVGKVCGKVMVKIIFHADMSDKGDTTEKQRFPVHDIFVGSEMLGEASHNENAL